MSDFAALFDDEVSYKNRTCIRQNLNLNSNETTDAQAEILWAGWVKPEFIKGHYVYQPNF